MIKWNKTLILILTFLVLIHSSISCKPTYSINQNVTIIDVIVETGEGAACNITTFNRSMSLVNHSEMDMTGRAYHVNLGILPRGIYTSDISCVLGSNIYLGECKFKVGDEFTMWDLAMIIGILGTVLLFAFLAVFFHSKAKDSSVKSLMKDAFWFKVSEFFSLMLIFVMLLILNNTSRLLAVDNGATEGIISMFNNVHLILMIFTIIFFLFMILRIIMIWIENIKIERYNRNHGNQGMI